MKTTYHIELIDKAKIAELSWPNEDLNRDKERLGDILIKLKVALILGNMEKVKCKILFMDNVGYKMTETTIWAVCEKNILLKSGIWIPIRRIIDIII